MSAPLVSIIVPTFERPRSLFLALTSIQQQAGISDGEIEIVVADDGSQDNTEDVVRRFQKNFRFRISYTTHTHDGFQLSRTRNDGVRESSAPYLIFLDGDCMMARDHVAQHLRRRRGRTVQAGYCYYLDQATSARVDEATVKTGAFKQWVPNTDRRQLMRLHWKAELYALLRHPRRPKLYGGDFGIWRRDYETVNGFNEEFTGWGCEDDEFRVRLVKAGVRVRSILRWTQTYHLWHPPVPSHPGKWQDGVNVQRLEQELKKPMHCEHGLRAIHAVNDESLAKSA